MKIRLLSDALVAALLFIIATTIEASFGISSSFCSVCGFRQVRTFCGVPQSGFQSFQQHSFAGSPIRKEKRTNNNNNRMIRTMMTSTTNTSSSRTSSTIPNNIKAALIDLSGTLHVGDDAIPGAIKACTRLQQQKSGNNNIAVKFLTNTSKTSATKLFEQLRRIGFGPEVIPSKEHILTSVGAARRFLLQHNLRPLCLVDESLMEDDLQGVDTQEPHNCVLVGLAPSAFTYDRLNQAFRLLLSLKEQDQQATSSPDSTNSPPRLIAIHRGKYFRDADHELSLGPGGFVTCLEEATGLEAVVMGKPSMEFFHSALFENVLPEETVMVGDDVIQDCGGAKRAGLGWAILVKTGKYKPGDEDKEEEHLDVVVDSIVEAVDYICAHAAT